MRDIIQIKFEPVPSEIKVFCIHKKARIGEIVFVWNRNKTIGLALGKITQVGDGFYIASFTKED
jgi:hypothetical protein